MYCYHCKKEISNESKFCPYCGNKVETMNTGKDKEEKLLFISKGWPEKKKKMMMACAVILCVCGGVILLLTSELYGSLRTTFSVIGTLAILGGAAAFIGTKYMSNRYDTFNNGIFAIYSEHIEGADANTHKTFSVRYEDILEIGKTTIFANPILQIETRRVTYTVLTNELDNAYHIIEAKLDELERIPGTASKSGARMMRCRECGHEIGQSADVCPFCGARTRYGSREKKKNMTLITICIAMVFIVLGVVFLLSDNLIAGLGLLAGGFTGIFMSIRDAK